MEIIDDRAVLVSVENPHLILNSIKKSKDLGGNQVLVHWGIEEARVLNSYNIKVPSPIERKYSWAGRYPPMAHQKTTASFFTLNQRAFCFNEVGCVDSETEYLSPAGWKKISEYDGGYVAQYWPNTRTAEFVSPNKYVKLPCNEMIRIKTFYGLDQLLSPEHRVLIESGYKNTDKIETVAASELLRRHDEFRSGILRDPGPKKLGTPTIAFRSSKIPSAFTIKTTTKMDMSDAHIRLMVAVIADGYFGSENTNHCTVRLFKERKKIRLRKLLTEAAIEYQERPCLPEGFTKFTFYAPKKWKAFGKEFWNCSDKQLNVITSEVMLWDGCTTRGQRFSTVSKESADFVQYAFSATGATARINVSDRRASGKSVEYSVQVRSDTRSLYVNGTSNTMWVEPSTDGFKYCFMVPSTYLVFRRNGCVFLSGNTGKTASAIWAADFLMAQKIISRALIICPISIMDAAWRSDLFNFAMHRTVGIAYGTAEKRKKVIAQRPDFLIINYDGVEIVKKEIMAAGYDLIIVDEASHYKNSRSNRWKTLNSMLNSKTWLWMMTGTPAAQGPLDAYGLAKLVNPAGVPKFYGSWRDKVMQQVSKFKWIPKENSTETVYAALQPAIRFTKNECLDLPDMVYTKRIVPLTRQQHQYYELLRKKLTMEAAGEIITAVNAASSMTKLLQISAGAVYTDGHETVEFDISNRYAVLKEVIDEASHKVLVFVPYRHTSAILEDKLRQDGVPTDVIHGDVPLGARTDIFRRFQTQTDPRVLLIQPQAASHGVTLTAADTVVWWSPTASLETYAQANARVHRKGQTNKCTVVQLQGSSVERHVYELLDNKIDVNASLVELFGSLLD